MKNNRFGSNSLNGDVRESSREIRHNRMGRWNKLKPECFEGILEESIQRTPRRRRRRVQKPIN